MAGGALLAPQSPSSIADKPIAHTGASGQRAASGRVRKSRPTPAPATPAISGGEPYSAATVEGWRRCDTSRQMEGVHQPGWVTGPHDTERAGVGVAGYQRHVAHSAAKAQPSMRQDSRVMLGVIIEVMMAMTRGNALLVTFRTQQRGARPTNQFQSDEPLHHRSDETSHQGLFPPSRSRKPLSWRFAVHKRNLDFSWVMRGLMMVLMRRNPHRGRHGLPHVPKVPIRSAGPLRCSSGPHSWKRARPEGDRWHLALRAWIARHVVRRARRARWSVHCRPATPTSLCHRPAGGLTCTPADLIQPDRAQAKRMRRARSPASAHPD